MRHGTEEQRQRWLPGLATGERRGAPLALGARRRQRHPQHLLPGRCATATSTCVNGTKTWVTNGERAGIVALAARTDEGITCFIVEKEPGPALRGHHRQPHIGKLGYKGVETVEMAYADHRVPAANLVGERRSRACPRS